MHNLCTNLWTPTKATRCPGWFVGRGCVMPGTEAAVVGACPSCPIVCTSGRLLLGLTLLPVASNLLEIAITYSAAASGKLDAAVHLSMQQTRPPMEVLPEAADDADLIIMGRHLHTHLAQIWHGTLAVDVSRHATCPVLIVPSYTNARSAVSQRSREAGS